MTRYTYAQLEGIWESNGGNKLFAPIAAAIAMAESGGNSQATNVNSDGSTDRGLWQINSSHGSLSTYDVNANAKAAVQISNNGTNFNPWVTYKSGAYLQFLKGNVPASAGAPTASPATADSAFGGLTWPGDIVGFFSDAKTFVDAGLWLVNPASWLRIGSFVIGILLILIAVYIFTRVSSDKPIISMPSTVPVPIPV